MPRSSLLSGWPDTSRKRVLVTLLSMVLVVAGAMVGSPAAQAGTAFCGTSCMNLYNPYLGTAKRPNVVMEVLAQSATVGAPLVLARASNQDPGEDFTISLQGTVADFYAAGLMSAAMGLNYPNLLASEIQYSPDGADSGLCAGVATTPTSGTPVGLQPCGVSAKTVWVSDPQPQPAGSNVLINGANNQFPNPFVLDLPLVLRGNRQLVTAPLLASSHFVLPTESWAMSYGLLPSA